MSEELEDLRAMARELFADRSAEGEVRRLMDTTEGFARPFWRELAGLGLLAMSIPAPFGGDGHGLSEVAVVMEEMGRALVCAPFLSTITAVNFLVAAADRAACERYLPPIAEGTLRATVALADRDGNLGGGGVTCSRRGRSFVLNGEKGYVVDGHTADVILVVVTSAPGTSLFAVRRTDPGLRATLLPTVDRTRKQASLTFAGVPAELIGEQDGQRAAVAAASDRTLIALACEQAGGASRAFDMAVGYAKERVQFGRQIGGFQAVKHLLADLTVDVESAISAARYAAELADTDAASLGGTANLAKFYCSEAFLKAANSNIQVHGGIGFTWEHPAHLYLRRARASSLMLGDPRYHKEQFLQRTFS